MTKSEAELAWQEAGKIYTRTPNDDTLRAWEHAFRRLREFDLAPVVDGTVPRVADSAMMMRDPRVTGARPPRKSKSLSMPSVDVIKSL